MQSNKKQARNVGILYFVLFISGLINLLYVPSQIIVAGDAAATAVNIVSSEALFRFGIFNGVVAPILQIFLVLLLFELFKQVNRTYAAVMLILVLVSVPAAILVTLNQVAALVALSGADFLSVFDKTQIDALAYFFLRVYSNGIQVIQLFWGLWLFPFALLVYRSGFIPKIFGVLLGVAGVGYLLASCISILVPQIKPAIAPLLMLMEICELPTIFWLLLVGARETEIQENIV